MKLSRFNRLFAPNHFVERCQERTPSVCPHTLFRGIAWAIHHERDDLAELVTVNPDTQTKIYRFKTPDGVFYAPVKNFGDYPVEVPITVLSQGMKGNTWRGVRRIPKALRGKPKEYRVARGNDRF